MKKIELLDCTLRDGGSLNNWKFGENNIVEIFQSLNDANIEIIETGFIDNNVKENPDCSINPDNALFDKLCKKIKNKKSKAYAMIDFSKYNRENFNLKKSEKLDGIRIMFKKEQLPLISDFCKKLQKLNYEICLNPVSITTYSNKELNLLIETANRIKPQIIYIVDTYGLLNSKETIKLFKKFDKNLDKEIKIGYHVHNNLQLALSNSVEIIKTKTNRTTVIDASLYGMGKRAGNTPIESIALYLNNNLNTTYNIEKLINIIEKAILPLRTKYKWGYSLIHYIAAIHKCHSDYVTHLYKDAKLSLDEIYNILKKIPKSKKLTFDPKFINKYTKN